MSPTVLLCALLASVGSPTPTEALSGVHAAEYQKALEAELNAHELNGTWEEVRRKKGMRTMTTRTIFTNKLNSDGEIIRFKARCVGRGFTQRDGIDYDETFASVVRYDTVKCIIAIAAAKNRLLYHGDFTTAYLNAPLEEDLYVELPLGYKAKMEGDVVLKLKKSLYGLKQSGRNWRKMIHKWMTDYGFVASLKDPCLYVLKHEGGAVQVGIYVDDLIICDDSDDPTVCNKFMDDIRSEFKMTITDDIDSYLSAKLERTEEGIIVSVAKSVSELLEAQGMTNAAPMRTPMAEHLVLVPAPENELLSDEMATVFRSIVGSLMHIQQFRPDIGYATGCLTHFMSKPGAAHLVAAKRVLRYLAGTVQLGLLFRKGSNMTLTAYVDSDYATDESDKRKSVTGFVTQFGKATISAHREKQQVTALSSTEAEYIAVTAVGKEIVFLRQLLEDMGYEQIGPTMVHEDNKGCYHLSENEMYHPRTKHIDIRYHWIRDQIQQGKFKLTLTPGSENVADIMTKPLGPTLFEKFRTALLGM